MKTKAEIINETVAYYDENPKGRRSTNAGGGCEYRNKDGNMCAVGRCFTEEGLNLYRGFTQWADDLNSYLPDGLDSILQPEYRDHPLGFWTDLQALHDTDIYWTAWGLTPEGDEFVYQLLNKWAPDD